MAGLGKYCMGGFGRIGVYRVKKHCAARDAYLLVVVVDETPDDVGLVRVHGGQHVGRLAGQVHHLVLTEHLLVVTSLSVHLRVEILNYIYIYICQQDYKQKKRYLVMCNFLKHMVYNN